MASLSGFIAKQKITNLWYDFDMKKIFFISIFGLLIITAVFLTIYTVGQQVLRQSANDPQIQMAEDAATQFQGGAAPQSMITSGTVNINESLSPYLDFYDPSGNPIAGTGILNGALPNLPAGIFDYTLKIGENRLTWQPQPGIRQAIVIVRITNSTHPGFVMAGRSLRGVEIREDNLFKIVALA